MTRYRGSTLKTVARGASKKTSVFHYTLSRDRIVITFRKGEVYTYSHASAGVNTVEQMRQLARSGAGLNRFINLYKPYYILGDNPISGDEQIEGDYDGD